MAGLTALEAELERAWRKYHIRAQIARFTSGFVAALVLGLNNGVGDWTTFAPIAGSAAWTAAMEAWPMMPWMLARQVVRRHSPPTRPPADPDVPTAPR